MLGASACMRLTTVDRRIANCKCMRTQTCIVDIIRAICFPKPEALPPTTQGKQTYITLRAELTMAHGGLAPEKRTAVPLLFDFLTPRIDVHP